MLICVLQVCLEGIVVEFMQEAVLDASTAASAAAAAARWLGASGTPYLWPDVLPVFLTSHQSLSSRTQRSSWAQPQKQSVVSPACCYVPCAEPGHVALGRRSPYTSEHTHCPVPLAHGHSTFLKWTLIQLGT